MWLLFVGMAEHKAMVLAKVKAPRSIVIVAKK